jgi:hypothetical protein
MSAHAQVILEAHQPGIANIDAVQEGEHEDDEDGDEEVAFP